MWTSGYGPVLEKRDVEDLFNGNKTVFVLSALRYKDGTGGHEAHACYFIPPRGDYPKSVNVEISFAFCNSYVSTVDITEP